MIKHYVIAYYIILYSFIFILYGRIQKLMIHWPDTIAEESEVHDENYFIYRA